MRKQYLAVAVLLACAVAAGRTAKGQVLADRVPADAAVYAGWAGSDALGPGYDASHLKSFLNTLNLPEFIGQRIRQEIDSRGGAGQTEDFQLIQAWLSAMAKSPTAFYLRTLDFAPAGVGNGAPPVPHLALFSKVGKENAGELAGKLNALFNRSNPPEAPVHGVKAVGDYLLVFAGDDQAAERLQAGVMPENLAGSDAFKRTWAQLGPGAGKSAAVMYVDGEALLRMVNAAMLSVPDPQARQLFPPIAEGMGLNGLKQCAWAGNFDGADWQSSLFVGMGERRKGVLAFFDSAPVTAESLKLIPKSATSAGVWRFDGARLLQDITDTAGAVSPDAPRQMETVLTQVWAWTGIDFKRELLPSMGDEFMFYGSPDAAGNSIRGLTIFNRLRDPQKAESAFAAAENFVNAMILQRNPNSKAQFQVQPLAAPLEKVSAHVIALENMTPAWAIHEGVFYFSLSLPALQNAIEMADGKKESLLGNPQFTALRKKLEGAGAAAAFSSFNFLDLKNSAPETYEIISHALASARAASADPTAAYTLPPLNTLTADLGPVLQIYWSDRDGFHARETGPFPLAGYLSPAQFLWLHVADQMKVQPAQAGKAAPATGPARGRP